MARTKCHLIEFAGIPRTHNDAPVVRVRLQKVNGSADLVDGTQPSLRVEVSPTAPLNSVDAAELPVFVGPGIPNTYVVLPQVVDVALAAQEPKQFVNDRTHVKPFCRKKREALLQVKAHLVPEDADGSRACPIIFRYAVFQYVPAQVEVLLHPGLSSLGSILAHFSPGKKPCV